MDTIRMLRACWESDRLSIEAIRFAVFTIEQSVPPELVMDKLDPTCTHAIAYDHDERAIATGRLQRDGKLGRIAVLQEYRGKGVGRDVTGYLIELAQEQGMKSVYLHAQLHALPFYRKNGFEPVGEAFREAGILHQKMCRRLSS